MLGVSFGLELILFHRQGKILLLVRISVDTFKVKREQVFEESGRFNVVCVCVGVCVCERVKWELDNVREREKEREREKVER